MLEITNLHVSIGGKEILKGINLSVGPGEVHAVMGPNGSGKSTLAYTLMGHPSYEVTSSELRVTSSILFNKKNIIDISADERAKMGIFLAFQSPVAIPGVSVGKFLRHIGKQRNKGTKGETGNLLKGAIEINKQLDSLAGQLHIKPELLKRDLNDNFSGGEKKKIETLQLLFLQPKLALIDEVDTGLDVDALSLVAGGIKQLARSGTSVIIITHYQRILKYLTPDRVHVMQDGRIVKSGTAALAQEIEDKGYEDIVNH